MRFKHLVFALLCFSLIACNTEDKSNPDLFMGFKLGVSTKHRDDVTQQLVKEGRAYPTKEYSPKLCIPVGNVNGKPYYASMINFTNIGDTTITQMKIVYFDRNTNFTAELEEVRKNSNVINLKPDMAKAIHEDVYKQLESKYGNPDSPVVYENMGLRFIHNIWHLPEGIEVDLFHIVPYNMIDGLSSVTLNYSLETYTKPSIY